jgi:hypothetical protein
LPLHAAELVQGFGQLDALGPPRAESR